MSDGRGVDAADATPIRVGIIGCGGMGSWHAGNVAAQPGLTVVAAADVVPAAAEAVATRFGARVDEPDAVAVADDVDAVVIASSDDSHARYAVPAIADGKGCLLEKPLGSTMAQADEILAAEVAAGRRLVRLGFMRELDPAHVQVAAHLAELGPVTSIRGVHRNLDPSLRPVEMLITQSLIHDIHTVRWLTGSEIDSVRAHVVGRSDGFRDVLLVCTIASGAVATLAFEDQAFGYEVQVEVTAEGGMAATLPHPRAVRRSAEVETLTVGADWFGRFEDAYRLEVEAWAADLSAGVATGPSVWDGYAAQAVADAALVAVDSGAEEPVTLPPRPALYGGS
ncbi:MAG: Gfo/Idh/MocA family oxidoreductase [Actinomycetota bacterium]